MPLTKEEHLILEHLQQELDEIKQELLGVIRRAIIWVVAAAFMLGSWSAAIQSQVWNNDRELKRLDTEGSVWSRDTRNEMSEKLTEIQSSLARIEERLGAHMDANNARTGGKE